jgi:hypothetical protein
MPELDEVVRISLSSPLQGACLTASCMVLAPGSPSHLYNATPAITGFSFNITLEAVSDLGIQPRFTARCIDILDTGERLPCPGMPDPLTTIAGDLPLAWSIDGLTIADPHLLLLEVQRDGPVPPPDLTFNDLGEGTGDDYLLEGAFHRAGNRTA